MQKGQLALKEISEYLISPADGVQSTAVGLQNTYVWNRFSCFTEKCFTRKALNNIQGPG